MANFNELKSTAKGNYGESLVSSTLTSKGCFIYTLSSTDNRPHPYDMVVVSSKDLAEPVLADVKTYESMIVYQAQGLDAKDYHYYTSLAEKNKFVLFFVDKKNKAILYQSIAVIKEKYLAPDGRTYPLQISTKNGDKVLIHLDQLKKLRDLEPLEIAELEKLTNISSKYILS